MLEAWEEALLLSTVKPLVPPVPSAGATVLVWPVGNPDGFPEVGVIIQLPRFGVKLPAVLEKSQSTPVVEFRNSVEGESSPAPVAKVKVCAGAPALTM